MTTRMESLLERLKKFEEEKQKLEGEISAVRAVDAIGANLAGYITSEAVKAKVDIKVLSGKFFALNVGDDGKLTVELATHTSKPKSNGNGGTNGANGGTTTTKKDGVQYEYVGTDGVVLGNTVQEAMVKLGIPDANRPKHNRYDRLSADWKNKIIQREKAITPETPAVTP